MIIGFAINLSSSDSVMKYFHFVTFTVGNILFSRLSVNVCIQIWNKRVKHKGARVGCQIKGKIKSKVINHTS